MDGCSADDKVEQPEDLRNDLDTTDVDRPPRDAKLGLRGATGLAYVKGGYALAVIRTTANEAPALPYSGNSSGSHNGRLMAAASIRPWRRILHLRSSENWIDLDAKTRIGSC